MPGAPPGARGKRLGRCSIRTPPGRTIKSRTIFTLCKACKALWDSEPGLQDTFRGTPVHAQVPGRRPEGVFGRLRRLPDADEPIPDASLPDPGQPARQGGQAGGTVRWDGCRCAGETAIRFPRASRSGPGSGGKTSAGTPRSAMRWRSRRRSTMVTRSVLTETLARLPAATAGFTGCIAARGATAAAQAGAVAQAQGFRSSRGRRADVP